MRRCRAAGNRVGHRPAGSEMAEARLEEAAAGTWQPVGELVFTTVTTLLKGANFRSSEAATIRIDLAGITRADSAGVALLVEWLRQAERAGKSLVLMNMPEQMRSIVRVCGLEQILTSVSA